MKSIKNKEINGKTAQQVNTPLVLDLGIKREDIVNGIEMGILENGVPYLTQGGLAKLCGVTAPNIKIIANEWNECHVSGIFTKGRMEFISSSLFNIGFSDSDLFIPVLKNNILHYAYPDIVCTVILEFYAFESKTANSTTALRSYRELTRKGLGDYIYESLRYQPDDPWKHYHDRVSLLKEMDNVPDGYFIVFNEIAGMMVDLINNGLPVNMYTIPDISVGVCWSRYWSDHLLDARFGEKRACSHYYPEGFNQAHSNPQVINAYPDTSLPEFRRWFKHEYLLTKFPTYMLKKAKLLTGGKKVANTIIEKITSSSLIENNNSNI